jgi:alpha-beta hydrolase superfamily lysophospholipase
MNDSRLRRCLALAAAGALCLAGACALLLLTLPVGVVRESVEIAGPGGRPCGGTLWLPREPVAVVILGHGVTENRGCMAALAKLFAANGYAVMAVDFWGHGQSRVPFDWGANPAQIHAWCAWARERFPGLPLGYLGHSMGGFAGT